MLLLIYIVLGLIVNGIALALNWKYHWITKEWIENHDIEFDLLMVCAALWPLGIIILIVMAIIMLIHKFLIPD